MVVCGIVIVFVKVILVVCGGFGCLCKEVVLVVCGGFGCRFFKEAVLVV